jgi:hypothetical protein
LTRSPKNKVTVCTSSDILVNDYKKQFATLVTYFGGKLQFMTKLPKAAKVLREEGNLLLVDEADFFMFGQPELMCKVLQSRPGKVIGFTATIGKMGSLEESYMK